MNNSQPVSEPKYLNGRETIEEALASVWTPKPRLSLVDWAYENITLPSKAAAEPGPLDFNRTPYAIGIAAEIDNPRNDCVVWVAGAQVAKTTLLAAAALKEVIESQAPTLIVLSTIALAEGFSKERLQPTIAQSPNLYKNFGDSKSKDSNNTILFKEALGGGHIVLIGSNSSSQMRSRPIRNLYLDEVSSYQENKEGDVVGLLKQRQVTFFDRTCVMASTPLFKGDRIESEYLKTDQRKMFVECPHCGKSDWLQWKNVKWDKKRPETAKYVCPHCETPWTKSERRRAINKGEWKPTAAPRAGFESTPGFHLSSLYSPWITLPQLATEWLEAQGDRLKLQTFINTKLAEGFEVSEYNDIDPETIQARAEDYVPGTVPEKALLLTCGVDVQKDRLVASVYAWGPGEECWLISYLNLYGNPLADPNSDDSPFPQLEMLLDSDFIHDSGAALQITLTNIDSGAFTQEIYTYVLSRQKRFRIHAINGLPGDREMINPPSYPKLKGAQGKRNKSGLQLWGIGVNRLKKLIYSRLNLPLKGPRYIHFPKKMPKRFFEDLTGEQITIKHKNGFPVEVWELKPGRENHALDCLVYAAAAAYQLRIDDQLYPWDRLRASVIPKPEEKEDIPIETKDAPKVQKTKPRINKFTNREIGNGNRRRNPSTRNSPHGNSGGNR